MSYIHVQCISYPANCYICRGEDDVALFDFTSLFASENAARIVERKGHKILLCVAGDSLTEVSCILLYTYTTFIYILRIMGLVNTSI